MHVTLFSKHRAHQKSPTHKSIETNILFILTDLYGYKCNIYSRGAQCLSRETGSSVCVAEEHPTKNNFAVNHCYFGSFIEW